MAKIKQKKMRLGLNPDRPYQETVISICYDASDKRRWSIDPPDKRFYIKLPQVVADALAKTEVRAEAQDSVMDLFKETIESFKSMKKETNKVILYNIVAAPVQGDKETDFRYHAPNRGLKVEVWAGTYIETVAIAGDGNRRYSYEDTESLINFPTRGYFSVGNRDGRKEENQVPWTEQNETFFVWIKEKLEELVNRLRELGDVDYLIDTISSGRLLPLGKADAVS